VIVRSTRPPYRRAPELARGARDADRLGKVDPPGKSGGFIHLSPIPISNREMDQHRFIQAYVIAVVGTVLVGALALLLYG
jgi:hypothetical protein